jgi:hypothetical protein
MKTRHLRLVAIVAIALILLFLIIGSTYSFHDCVQKIKNYATNSDANGEAFGIVRLFHHVRVIGQCELVGLDEHSGIVTAIAGLIVAAFTYTLWQSTDRLWEAGEKQLKHAKSTAEHELRAYLHIHDIRMSEMNSGFDPNIQIAIRNFGQTPAREITNTLNVVAATQPMEGTFTPGNIYELADLAPGQQVFSQTTLPSNQWATWKPNIVAKTLTFYVFGRIDYVDAFGEPRFSEYRLRLPIDTRGIIDESSLIMDNRAGNRTI